MSKVNKTDLSFNIKLITENDIPTVISTFTDEFLCDEPLNGSIGLTKERESVEEHVEFCKNYLKKGISVMALSESGEVMGGIINNVMDRNDVQYDGNFDNCSKLNSKVVKFLYNTKLKSDVFGQYPNVDRILDMNIIAVNRAYRGHGICESLTKKSKELALELGCQMIYVECSSYYTAKAAEKLGFKCIHSVTYADYIDEKGEVVFKTQPPHKCFQVYALLFETTEY